MILKINNGALEIRSNGGVYEKTLVLSDVIDADLNRDETLVVVTTRQGQVTLYKVNGGFVRTISTSGAKRAKWSSKDVAITLDNGKVELRSEGGVFIRVI